ncbi:reverse transcriptase domain-containing protein [Aerococcus viridans]|uniref:reverse transcriptase domain-containing protein n=1 Tax=Aerococcus viridans TaxID=1377 RepID=UPI001CA5E651|nr:reverse transcriptase domain-containing protein [Aerococcus viridans]
MENKFPFDRSKYRPKNYIHIDKSLEFKKVEGYVCDPDKIAKHSFLPLIHYIIETPKYKVDKIKQRHIRYAGHLDSYIYKYYADQLNSYYNLYCEMSDIDECSIAYRNNKIGKANVDFAAEIFNLIKKQSSSYIIVGDFKSFFDTLDHKMIKVRMKEVLNIDTLPSDWFNIYKSIIKYGSIKKEVLEELPHVKNDFGKKQSYFSSVNEFRKIKNKKKNLQMEVNTNSFGIPQGTPISAVIANVYSIGFDKSMKELADNYEGVYRRYSDDFILVIPSKQDSIINVKEIYKQIEKYSILNKMKLEDNKSKVLKCNNGQVIDANTNESSKIDYLGFIFDGKTVKLRDKSISKFYKKANKLIRHAKKIQKNKNLKKLPYRRSIYNLYTDMGKSSRRGNFISYAKRAQEVFDKRSPETDNQILKQIENRKRNIEKRLGYRIHVKL